MCTWEDSNGAAEEHRDRKSDLTSSSSSSLFKSQDAKVNLKSGKADFIQLFQSKLLQEASSQVIELTAS